jgi:hypothetical protein
MHTKLFSSPTSSVAIDVEASITIIMSTVGIHGCLVLVVDEVVDVNEECVVVVLVAVKLVAVMLVAVVVVTVTEVNVAVDVNDCVVGAHEKRSIASTVSSEGNRGSLVNDGDTRIFSLLCFVSIPSRTDDFVCSGPTPTAIKVLSGK